MLRLAARIALFPLLLGCGDTSIFEVFDRSPVDRVEIVQSTSMLLVGESERFRARVLDRHGRVLPDYPGVWSSSPRVAVVDTTGLVLGVAPGMTGINFSAGGKQAIGVMLNVRRMELRLEPDSLVLVTPGKAVQLRAFVTEPGSSGTRSEGPVPVRWLVFDPNIAVLEHCTMCVGTRREMDATVTPRQPGTTRIIVSWRNLADTAVVHVRLP